MNMVGIGRAELGIMGEAELLATSLETRKSLSRFEQDLVAASTW